MSVDRVGITFDAKNMTRPEMARVGQDLDRLRAKASALGSSGSQLKDVFQQHAAGLRAVQLAAGAATAAYGAFLAKGAALGIRFNETLESSRLGIAAVLKTFQPDRFKDFNAAIAEASDAIEVLKVKAKETSASFVDLVSGWQAIAGAASAAGIPIAKQIDLVLRLSQAIGGLGLPGEQFRQEARTLLTGNIDRSAFVAQTLGITREQVLQAREQGRLYEFLTDKLRTFGEAGKLAQTTFTGAFSNLKDVVEQVAGELTKGAFEVLKKGFLDLQGILGSPEFKAKAKGVADDLRVVVSALVSLTQWAARNPDVIYQGFKTLAVALTTFMAASAALKTFKAAGSISGALLGVGSLNTLRDYGAALTLLFQRGAVFLRANPWVIAIEAITAALILGIRTWQLWGAQAEEKMASGELAKQNDIFIAKIRERIQLLQQQGRIEASLAQERLAQLRYIEENRGNLTETDIAQALHGYLRQLTDIKRVATEAGLAAKKLGGVTLEVFRAQVGGAAGVELAKLNQDEMLLEDTYRKRLLSLEDYLRAREQIIRERFKHQTALLEGDVAGGDPEAKAKAEYEIKAKQVEMETELLKLQLKAEDEREQSRKAEVELAMQEREAIEAESRRIRDAQRPTTARDGMGMFNEWLETIGSSATLVYNLLTGLVGGAINSLSNGIMGLIDGTKTWGQVMLDFGRMILQTLIQVAVQMAVVRAIGGLIGGPVGFMAFAEGGLVPGQPSHRDNQFAAVASGEYVVSTAAVQHYGPAYFEALNRRAIPRPDLSGWTMPGPSRRSGSFATGGLVAPTAGGPVVNVAPSAVHVAVLKNENELTEFLQTRRGRKVLLDVLSGSKLELGIPS